MPITARMLVCNSGLWPLGFLSMCKYTVTQLPFYFSNQVVFKSIPWAGTAVGTLWSWLERSSFVCATWTVTRKKNKTHICLKQLCYMWSLRKPKTRVWTNGCTPKNMTYMLDCCCSPDFWSPQCRLLGFSPPPPLKTRYIPTRNPVSEKMVLKH